MRPLRARGMGRDPPLRTVMRGNRRVGIESRGVWTRGSGIGGNGVGIGRSLCLCRRCPWVRLSLKVRESELTPQRHLVSCAIRWLMSGFPFSAQTYDVREYHSGFYQSERISLLVILDQTRRGRFKPCSSFRSPCYAFGSHL